MKKFSLLAISLIVLFIASCKKDDDEEAPSIQYYSTNIYTEADFDGYIVNSTPKIVENYYNGGQGKEITIGWNNNGFAMRGFISFNYSNLLPASGNILVLDEAILKVYEANTNLNPFNGEGARTIQCYLIDYNSLDATDFDAQTLYSFGNIVTSGSAVLRESAINVTTKLAELIKVNQARNKFQFRLQFTNDSNVPDNHVLEQAMWNSFAGEEVTKTAFKPTLYLKYHYENK